MKILISNIKFLVQTREDSCTLVKGKDMKNLPVMEDAWLAISDGKIEDYGSVPAQNGRFEGYQKIDANGGSVFPSWVDSHTHIVYAGNREGEFVDRINGKTYEEIAQAGGGILNSAKKLRNTSEEELYQQAWTRLNQVMAMGTGAVEIKSGYGLSIEAELKMLRVIKRLRATHPLTIKSTFLGAHALPVEFKNDKSGYIDLVVNEMLPAIAKEKLADYIDIFCESGYFDVADLTRVLKAGNKYGLKGKTHVNQFTSIGGVGASVKLDALSVDHLEVLTDADVNALKKGNTMPVALPGCSLFLSIPYTPARNIIDSDLPLALATDFNPGSCPSGNMNLVVSLACVKMKMNPEEAINAATINGAYAMELSKELGCISKGKKANVFITKPIPSYGYVPYSFGETVVDKVIINGSLIKDPLRYKAPK